MLRWAFMMLLTGWSFGADTPPRLASQAGPQSEVPTGPTRRIKEVVFVGNRILSEKELRAQLEFVGAGGWLSSLTGRDPVYTRERALADVVRLRQYMGNRGYLNASIGEPIVEYLNPDDAERKEGDIPIRLTFRINEGALHRLNTLTVRGGGTVLTNEQARAQFNLKAGEVLRANLIEEGLNRLRQIYGRLGYLQFAPTLDFKLSPVRNNEVLADLTITLNEGAQFTLSRLDFTGNIWTLGNVLRQMIPLDEGEVFNYARLEQGIDRLNRSGLFEPIAMNSVVINFNPAERTASVVIQVVERDRQRWDVSGGGGTTGGANVGFDYSNFNLTGRADNVSLQLRLGTRERLASGQYAVSLLTYPPVELNFTGYYQQLEFVDARTREEDRRPLYIQNAAGASVGLSLPLSRSRFAFAAPTRAGVIYSFTSTALEDLLAARTGTISDLEQRNIRQAALTPFLSYNTLDRNFDPNRGRRLTLSLEVGGRALGGNVNTIRPFVDYRQFIPFGLTRGERRVFGFRVRAAHIAAFGEPFSAQVLSQVGGVPIFNRFFLGGDTEVRGYQVNSIAPLARVDRLLVVNDSSSLLASDVRPIGGDTLLLANAEYRVPLTRWLSTAAFFDLGASFNARSLDEQRFESPTLLQPGNIPTTVVTVVRPLGSGQDGLPPYRVSVGAELRFQIPSLNLPLRLIFAYNPNAQRRPADPVLLAPERRFVFRIGLGRTL